MRGFLIFSCGKSAQLKGQKEALLKQKGKTTSGPKMYSWEGTVLGEGRDKEAGFTLASELKSFGFKG